MWTADSFLEHLEKGRVITKNDLRNVIIQIRSSEYERGCEAMRILYSDMAQKKKSAKIKKRDKEFNQIANEISDYVYKKRQAGYYGEENVDSEGRRKEISSTNDTGRTRKRVGRLSNS